MCGVLLSVAIMLVTLLALLWMVGSAVVLTGGAFLVVILAFLVLYGGSQ